MLRMKIDCWGILFSFPDKSCNVDYEYIYSWQERDCVRSKFAEHASNRKNVKDI